MSNDSRFCNECKMCCHKKQWNSIRKAVLSVKDKLVLYRRRVFHYLILIILTCYVILNWEKCISMQFFSQFDGNNILFLLWLILIFLIIYNVKIGDNTVFDRDSEKQKELVQKFRNNDLSYWCSQMQETNTELSSFNILKGGNEKNEKSIQDKSPN